MKKVKLHLVLSSLSLMIVSIINQNSLAIGQTEKIPFVLYSPAVTDASIYYGVGVRQFYGADFRNLSVAGPTITFHLPSFILSWLALWLMFYLVIIVYKKFTLIQHQD